jgi:hypothetical protein
MSAALQPQLCHRWQGEIIDKHSNKLSKRIQV